MYVKISGDRVLLQLHVEYLAKNFSLNRKPLKIFGLI